MAAIKTKGITVNIPNGVGFITEKQAETLRNASMLKFDEEVLFRFVPDSIPEASATRLSGILQEYGVTLDEIFAVWKHRTYGNDGTLYTANEINLVGGDDANGNYKYMLVVYEA